MFHGSGGWGGIRTHETLAGLPVFKTGAFNRSATHPWQLRPDGECRPSIQNSIAGPIRIGHMADQRHRSLLREGLFEPNPRSICRAGVPVPAPWPKSQRA